WKSVGIKPSGIVVNALVKPSEAQVASWNKKRVTGKLGVKDYIRGEREPFLRTTEDLLRVENQYREICDEWEDRIVSGRWPLSNIKTTCLSYNRRCDYHGMCLEHDSANSIEALGTRREDYVDEKYLVQIQPVKENQ